MYLGSDGEALVKFPSLRIERVHLPPKGVGYREHSDSIATSEDNILLA